MDRSWPSADDPLRSFRTVRSTADLSLVSKLNGSQQVVGAPDLRHSLAATNS